MPNYYTVTADGVDICETYGVTLSKFEQEPPEPKIITVDIPAGVDIDITNAIGATAFHNGVHRFVFAITGTDIVERTRALKNALHGYYKFYELSWDSGYTYKGRWQVTEIERLSYDARLVTVEVSHYPYKIKRETVDILAAPTGSYTIAGSNSYDDVSITLHQYATVVVNGNSVRLDAGTHMLGSGFTEDVQVSVTYDDWYYRIEGTNLIVNPNYATVSGSNVDFDNTVFAVDGTNIRLIPGEASQHAQLSFTRRDV